MVPCYLLQIVLKLFPNKKNVIPRNFFKINQLITYLINDLMKSSWDTQNVSK